MKADKVLQGETKKTVKYYVGDFRMKKRIIAFVLSLCMCMSLCSSVVACGYEDASLSTSQLFNDATAQEILTAYAKEIQLIESEHRCSITGFTSDNIEMILRRGQCISCDKSGNAERNIPGAIGYAHGGEQAVLQTNAGFLLRGIRW